MIFFFAYRCPSFEFYIRTPTFIVVETLKDVSTYNYAMVNFGGYETNEMEIIKKSIQLWKKVGLEFDIHFSSNRRVQSSTTFTAKTRDF